MHAGSSILRLFELAGAEGVPMLVSPNQTTTTCPLASAASQGNTFDFPPTVAPEFTWVGVVQVVP